MASQEVPLSRRRIFDERVWVFQHKVRLALNRLSLLNHAKLDFLATPGKGEQRDEWD
ncbi:MAG: hypothetical protein RIB60_06175 [Phycisphaerales bacterium]